jgi:hypothetical protein
VTLVGGATETADFGYTGTGSIGDSVWYDINGDGIQDPGEPGLESVTVDVTWFGPDGVSGTADDVTYAATTAADGSFALPNLPAGDYTVTVDPTTIPPGMVATFDADGGNDSTTAVTLGAGEAADAIDFGYTGTASIGDQVWLDADGDGAEDLGEPDIADVTVTLVWAGVDTVLGTADDVALTTQTVAGNSYVFTNLPAGDFTVTVDTATLPGGLTATFDLDGGLDDTAAVTLVADEARTDVDFGYTGTGSIEGVVFEEINNDGIFDPFETPLAGVTVTATWYGPDGVPGTADDVVYTVVSGADGTYSFPNLPAGDYDVTVDTASVPAGLVSTTGGDTQPVTVGEGAAVSGIDFGYGENLPPLAVDDTATTDEDVPVTIPVLDNDSDPNGDTIAVDSVTQPPNGTVVVNPDGTVTYTPDAAFSGTDSFTYTVCEVAPPLGGEPQCDTATVTVTVNPVNHPPVIANAPGVLTQDIQVGETPDSLVLFDEDGDAMTVAVTAGTLPPGVTLNPDGMFSGEATTAGVYTFTIEVCDDGTPQLCTTATMTITVGALPTTGGPLRAAFRFGLVLLAAGLLLLLFARRRRRWAPV